jgi:hypothetical protein
LQARSAFAGYHPDHNYIGDRIKIKLLRLENGVAASGAELTTVKTFSGGQGSGNTNGWAPDSRDLPGPSTNEFPGTAK